MLAEDAAFEDDAPPEEPPETPPAVAKVDVDDVAFVRNIEAELKKLAIGDPDLFADEAMVKAAAGGPHGGHVAADAGALSDLLERYRKELVLLNDPAIYSTAWYVREAVRGLAPGATFTAANIAGLTPKDADVSDDAAACPRSPT